MEVDLAIRIGLSLKRVAAELHLLCAMTVRSGNGKVRQADRHLGHQLCTRFGCGVFRSDKWWSVRTAVDHVAVVPGIAAASQVVRGHQVNFIGKTVIKKKS